MKVEKLDAFGRIYSREEMDEWKTIKQVTATEVENPWKNHGNEIKFDDGTARMFAEMFAIPGQQPWNYTTTTPARRKHRSLAAWVWRMR